MSCLWLGSVQDTTVSDYFSLGQCATLSKRHQNQVKEPCERSCQHRSALTGIVYPSTHSFSNKNLTQNLTLRWSILDYSKTHRRILGVVFWKLIYTQIQCSQTQKYKTTVIQNYFTHQVLYEMCIDTGNKRPLARGNDLC